MRARLVVLSVLLAFAAGIAAERARSQAKPRMWADVVLDLSTDEIPRRTRVHVNVDHWEPGAETGRHTHPGPTVFVLLEGELEEVLPDGRSRTLKAGQGFWRPARTEHNVRNRSGAPARGVAVHLDPAR
ncbi:MAG: cupin domain-containing protein [Candidatus Rokubacteria bacterium]|nr:cupin domain-containing protein [Candidatus Rokubacteria bacterium]